MFVGVVALRYQHHTTPNQVAQTLPPLPLFGFIPVLAEMFILYPLVMQTDYDRRCYKLW